MRVMSLRSKFVINISLFVVVLLTVIVWGTYSYFYYTTRELIFSQQFSSLQSIARRVDHDIAISHYQLINVAKVAPKNLVQDRALVQKWLDDRNGIRIIFNHSLVILDKNGVLIAMTPANHVITSEAASVYQDALQRSIGTGEPYKLAPFATMIDDCPVVMMTAPIRSKDGAIQGFLLGAINLLGNDGFFQSLMDTSIGSTGYLYMFALDRTMIMHPDPSRIMKKDVNPRENKYFDRALEGYEGSGETINSKGQLFLGSFTRLQSTGWILAANYPVAEAYQPIINFRNYYLCGMIFVLLFSMGLAWKLGIKITQPLTKLTNQIRNLSQLDEDKKLRLGNEDIEEINQLRDSFNTLLDEVHRREQELKKTNYCLTESVITANAAREMQDRTNQELIKLNEQLERTSRIDSLTNLYNRRHMIEKIEEEFEQFLRVGKKFSLVIADIDFFKKINDTYGHDAGDYLLQSIADDFRGAVRECDIVARWGGEEFLFLLPGTSLEQAKRLAGRVREKLEERQYLYCGVAMHITMTFGVATIRYDDTINEIMKRADYALYEGKHNGRNCVITIE